jgi:hypothetical protein
MGSASEGQPFEALGESLQLALEQVP